MNNIINPNTKLTNLPKIHAFIAYAAVAIKGKSFIYWMEALKDYYVAAKCPCGKCYTFGLIPPDGNGPFGLDGKVGIIGDTVVVLHDENGRLVEVELPEITDIPFLDEYILWDTSDPDMSVANADGAATVIQQWFDYHAN